MQQLINHTSQESAIRHDFFPYNYGHYSSMLMWVDSKPKKGQRVITRTYNPYTHSWPKPKESAFYDLVFFFRNPYTGFADEQCINLFALTNEEILHIVANYYVTPAQKDTIQKHLSRVPNAVYTVWAQHEVPANVVTGEPAAIEVVPYKSPISQFLLSYPHPNNAIPAPDPIEPARPAGRPPLDKAEAIHPLSAIEKKRKKLHDKEALDLAPERRDFYYEMIGKNNPDRYTDEQIELL